MKLYINYIRLNILQSESTILFIAFKLLFKLIFFYFSYVNILTSKLKQRLQSIEKVDRLRTILKEKTVQYNQEAFDLRPKLKKLVEHTQVLQQQIQNYISKRYKNRVVEITGANYSVK